MRIRDARPEDAAEASTVLRRSITELCAADHKDDPTLLSAWLRNKTPETVAAWMRRADASYLVAVEGDALAAVGAVTDTGEILLNYVSPDARFRGVSHALLAALESSRTRTGRDALHTDQHGNGPALLLARADTTRPGAPVRKFGMDSGYPMSKVLAPSPPLPGGAGAV